MAEPTNDASGRAEREDWRKYAEKGARNQGAGLSSGDPQANPDEELYLAYRYENGLPGPAQEDGTRVQHRGNKIGIAIVVGVALLGVGGALLTGGLSSAPNPTQAPVAAASPTEVGTPIISIPPPRSPRPTHVGVKIELPFPISINDREQTPEDGGTIFLTGQLGAFALNPGTGEVLSMYGGQPFARGVSRSLIQGGGLWTSWWPASHAVCGRDCWQEASTYRIDLASGATTLSLPSTYLIGATSDGIWVASGQVVSRLDASTGASLGSTPWGQDSEPRAGCDSLYSYQPGTTDATLSRIDPADGAVKGTSRFGLDVSYGPTYVEGQCWMMSGSGGVSLGSTTLAWLNPDGSTARIGTFERSVVTLDREFWSYDHGTLQRFEGVTGYNYGSPFVLAVKPPGDDPRWLFAATSGVWMVSGSQLIGFDIPTGASRSNL